jgi:hypothetical protein
MCVSVPWTMRVIVFFVTILAADTAAEAAQVSVATPQTVLEEGKADSLLLSEIPQVIGEWTQRCTSKEAVQDPESSRCWQEAASSLTRYTAVYSESLVRQVEQLQTAWLERAAQLQFAPRQSAEETVKRRKPGRASQATTKPAGEKAGRKQQSPKQALKPANRRKVKIEAAAVQHPRDSSPVRSSSRRAELRKIRRQLETIANELECSTIKCRSRRAP